MPFVHEQPTSPDYPGFQDRLLYELLIPALSEFRHTTAFLPFERRNRTLSTDESTCAPGVLKTSSRESSWRFSSKPVFHILASGIYVLSEHQEALKPYMNAAGAVELGRLLSDGRIKLGMALGRSAGATIDQIIAQAGDKNIVHIATQQPTENLVRMLAVGRLDAMHGQPFEMPLMARMANLDEQRLIYLPIAEQEPVQQIFMACNLSPAGKTRMAQIDAVLDRPGVRIAAQDFYESRIRPGERAKLRKLLAGTR